jgi:hypothetical protein
MSRGPGKLQHYLFVTIRHSGTPLTFAEILKLAYPPEEPYWPPLPWEIRSLRRALHKMVKDKVVLTVGAGGPGDPYRYCIHPMLVALSATLDK